MVVTNLTWLHISDFHFRADGDLFSQRTVSESLCQSLESLRQELDDVAFVAVTGDIAFSGSADQYEVARDFLMRVAAIVEVPPDRFYIVPGNHDVDRDLNALAYYGALQEISSPQKVDYYLGDPSQIQPLRERQGAFWEFLEAFSPDQNRLPLPDGLGYAAELTLDNLVIAFLCLNSAWMSGSDGEEMKLVIGERQIMNGLNALTDLSPHLVFALAHHPISLLTEWDSASCRARLLPVANFFLRGHLHAHEVLLSSTPDKPCVEIAAGAGHADRFYGNSFNIASLNFAAGSLAVSPHVYFPSNACFEPRSQLEADFNIRGELDTTREDLDTAIRRLCPGAEDVSWFMAGILVDAVGDIPVLVESEVDFVAPSAASALASERELQPILEFLKLKNLIPLYPHSSPLDDRLGDFKHPLRECVEYLVWLKRQDPEGTRRMQRTHGRSSHDVDHKSSKTNWSVEVLDELRASEDWISLESVAHSLQESHDTTTRRKARASLAEALIHSDESPKREEGYQVASSLLSDSEATDQDLLLVAAAAEMTDRDDEAIELVTNRLRGREALTDSLLEYAGGLSMRTGNRELRQLLEETRRQEG